MALQGSGIQKMAAAIGLVGGRLSQGVSQPSEEQKSFNDLRAGIRANIRKYGIQKPSFAIVNFALPKIFQPQQMMDGDEIPSLVDVAEIATLARYRNDSFIQPGVQMSTSEIKRYGVGTIERKPVVPVFLDLPFRYINDSDGVLRRFFAYWMQGIINYQSLPTGADAVVDKFGKRPMEVEYKENYSTDIQIIQYNDANEKVMVINLYNAYPMHLSDISNSWGFQDQFTEFNVTYTYTHWDIEEIDAVDLRPPKQQRGGDFSLLKSLVQASTIVQQVSQMKTPGSYGDVLTLVNTGASIVKSATGSQIDY